MLPAEPCLGAQPLLDAASAMASLLRPYGDSLASATAGVAASMAAKLAGNTPLFEHGLQMLSRFSVADPLLSDRHSLTYAGLLLAPRLACYAVMLALNGIMLAHLTRSMALHGTLRATTLSNTISFVLSGLAGALLLGEELTLRWLLGMAVGMTGLALFQTGQSQDQLVAAKKVQ